MRVLPGSVLILTSWGGFSRGVKDTGLAGVMIPGCRIDSAASRDLFKSK